MKRGLITWDRAELPPAALESRLDLLRRATSDRQLPAVAIYSDVLRSNRARHFVNLMPYWNRSVVVIPVEGGPILLCGLSPRVYPWIRSVTTIENIVSAGNPAHQMQKLAAEKRWNRIGMLDLDNLPDEIYAPLRASGLELVDVPSGQALTAPPDRWELAMHTRGIELAREILAAELPRGTGVSDREFSGRLERAFRYRGAEDLVTLFSDGRATPAPASGKILGDDYSVAVALEYRGHWVRLARAHVSGDAAPALEERFEATLTNLKSTDAPTATIHDLSGIYPYEERDASGITENSIFAVHIELHRSGKRLFYGDTCRLVGSGAVVL